jgi:hypothetical protein
MASHNKFNLFTPETRAHTCVYLARSFMGERRDDDDDAATAAAAAAFSYFRFFIVRFHLSDDRQQ